jgi:hypothetical protein
MMLRLFFFIACWMGGAWAQMALASGTRREALSEILKVEAFTQLADGELKRTQESGMQTEGALETVWLQSNTDPVIRYEMPFAKVEERSSVLAEYFRTYGPTLELDAFYSDRDLAQINRYLVFGPMKGDTPTLGAQRFMLRLKMDRPKDFQVMSLQSARMRGNGKPAFTCPLSAGTMQESPYFKKTIWQSDGKLQKAFTLSGSDSKCLHLFAYLLFWGDFANPLYVRDQFVGEVAQGLTPMIEAYELPFPAQKLEQLTSILRGVDKDKVPWETPVAFWAPYLAATEYGQVEESVMRTFSNRGTCSQVLTVTYKPYEADLVTAQSIPVHTDRHAYAPASPHAEDSCKAYLDEAYEAWKKNILFVMPKKIHLGHFKMQTVNRTTKPKGATIEERKTSYLGFYKEAVTEEENGLSNGSANQPVLR